MAEIRFGHDQVTLPITRVRIANGAVQFSASGRVDPEKVKKLTGDQPIVVVDDSGEIVAAWHRDLTDEFAAARKSGVDFILIDQDWKILTVQNLGI